VNCTSVGVTYMPPDASTCALSASGTDSDLIPVDM
jgi:hypothetical protein